MLGIASECFVAKKPICQRITFQNHERGLSSDRKIAKFTALRCRSK